MIQENEREKQRRMFEKEEERLKANKAIEEYNRLMEEQEKKRA